MKPATSLDYDRVAEGYDRRYQADGYAGVRKLLARVRSQTSGPGLEIGCGTGHWLPLLGGEGTGEALGLDRSRAMLRRARAKAASRMLCQADAGDLPLAPALAGLVVCVNALHHFPDPQRFIHEAARVLGQKGGLLVIGFDARDPLLDWYLYHYFEGVQARDRQRYPDWETVEGWLKAAGMRAVESGVAHRIRANFRGREVLDDPFLERKGTSQLALLSDEAYQRGLARLRGALEAAPREAARATFKVRIDLVYVLAVKAETR